MDLLLESNPSSSTIGDSVDSFGSAVGAGTDYVAIGAPVILKVVKVQYLFIITMLQELLIDVHITSQWIDNKCKVRHKHCNEWKW